jgi:hypothetical protein
MEIQIINWKQVRDILLKQFGTGTRQGQQATVEKRYQTEINEGSRDKTGATVKIDWRQGGNDWEKI